MNVLLLAPHPFYQDRGTPIAVDLLIRVLTENGHQVDCLCFSEGADRHYPNFRLFRANSIPPISGIRPGFSLKKLYMDLFFFFRFVGLFIRYRYDVVHAVEESAFMAMVVCKLFRRRFIYDMDSSMVTQLLDKSAKLKSLEGSLRWVESLPMRAATVVIPVCDALADEAKKYRKEGIFILKDVSLVNVDATTQPGETESLKQKYQITGPLLMYIGNLESYQGIDLLLESFAIAVRQISDARVVIIGGEVEHIAAYKAKVSAMGIADSVLFLGKRPVSQINDYMTQADLMVSPRVHGVNTPMKVYSYLDSGVAVLATRLPTHTQVMTDEFGFLADDTPAGFADSMLQALQNPSLREQKARAAKEMIAREHSIEAFTRKLNTIYEFVGRTG